jgi:hypothetical protein
MATEQEWLDADNHKIILVDIAYHDGTSLNTKYFSSYPYVLKYGDSFTNILGDVVSSIPYEDILLDIPKLTTKINSSSAVGSITLLNTEGEFDNLLDITNAWEGHDIKIYIGSPTWARSQFILILDGITNALTAPQQHALSISLRDKKEILNVTTQSSIIWNTSNVLNYLNDNIASTGLYDKFATIFNKKLYDTTGSYIPFDTSLGIIPSGIENSLVPICLGKVFNIEPVLVDSYNHVYQIHECPDATNYGITEVLELRSNGVKLTGINDSYVDTLIAGTGGTVEEGLTVSSIVADTITVTGADFDTNGYSRAVIHNITLDEARYVIGSTSSTIVSVNTNANNVDAQTAGWTTGDTYDIWYPTNAPSIYELQYEENLTAGCIRLLIHDRSSQITCDVIGQTTRTQYTDNVIIPDVVLHSAAALIEYLVLEKTSLEVNSALDTDICPETFSPTGSIAFTNTDSLGIYIKEESTILNKVTEIMKSVGGYFRFGRVCVLQIFRFIDPEAETSSLTITEDSVIKGGLTLANIELPEKSINLGYSKNWTIQDKAAVAASVLESDNLEFLDKLTTDFSNIISYTGLTTAEYPLLTDSDSVGTLIYSEADACITIYAAHWRCNNNNTF